MSEFHPRNPEGSPRSLPDLALLFELVDILTEIHDAKGTPADEESGWILHDEHFFNDEEDDDGINAQHTDVTWFRRVDDRTIQIRRKLKTDRDSGSESDRLDSSFSSLELDITLRDTDEQGVMVKIDQESDDSRWSRPTTRSSDFISQAELKDYPEVLGELASMPFNLKSSLQGFVREATHKGTKEEAFFTPERRHQLARTLLEIIRTKWQEGTVKDGEFVAMTTKYTETAAGWVPGIELMSVVTWLDETDREPLICSEDIKIRCPLAVMKLADEFDIPESVPQVLTDTKKRFNAERQLRAAFREWQKIYGGIDKAGKLSPRLQDEKQWLVDSFDDPNLDIQGRVYLLEIGDDSFLSQTWQRKKQADQPNEIQYDQRDVTQASLKDLLVLLLMI